MGGVFRRQFELELIDVFGFRAELQRIGIRFAVIDPPAKDSSGDYQWTDADLERARQALAMRSQRTNSREVAL